MSERGEYLYEFPRPAVTVDALVFVLGEIGLEVLLIERGRDPFAGAWALPGGFVDPDEPLEVAVRRELMEETSLAVGPMIQVGAFGTPGRDPRGHTIGVGFIACARKAEVGASLVAGDDAAGAAWFAVDEAPVLAFDHDDILREGADLLRRRAWFDPVALELVGPEFDDAALKRCTRALLGDGPRGERLFTALLESPAVVRGEGGRLTSSPDRWVPLL